MNLGDVVDKAQRLLRNNSTTILTALGVSGTISTAYLAGKASYRAANVLAHEKVYQSKKDDFKVVWKLYVPSAISGVLTVACIIAATKAGSKKTAAAYSLLSVSEKAFAEYREKVVEQIGEKKEKAVRDEIAQDHVNANPVSQVVVIGSGAVLCYEKHTGRYFNCDMETLKKAQNEINAKMVRETGASLWDFYYAVGLPATTYCHNMGWENCKLLELEFTTTLSDDGRPCLAFDYNYIEPF